ncbi:MAG: acetyl-CoA carboxylase biotin carboxyl carrier protein [Fusobacteriaceae bacterium]|nr:acetyl-CoA carboxylase biotin carboxyl carrier protein [Fusobacteriaceae bacterium]
MKFDIQTLKALAKSLNENDIAEFSYEEEGTKVTLKRGQEMIQQTTVVASAPVMAAPVVQQQVAPVAAPIVAESTLPAITSPMVGTFYASNQPGAPAFVKEGDTITEGQVLCIVEAMKLMNEVKSDKSGKIVKVLVKNGEPVKKGDKLFIIE